MLYMVYGVDASDAKKRRADAIEDHFAYLEAHKDILVLGGATLGDDGETRTGSVLIVNLPDRTAANVFAENEPFRKAGVFEEVAVTRMRRGQWNPDAAPKTPEGN
jgi:hypothetical protein